MVTVANKLTRLANKCPDCERHLLSVAALATSLGCIPGVSSFEHAAGTFSLALRDTKKLTPPDIRNRFGQRGMPDHPSDVQVFDADPVEAVNDLLRFFVVKILARAADFEMSQGNFISRLFAPMAAFLLPAESPLLFREILFGLQRVARVVDLLPIAQSRKFNQPHVNTDGQSSFSELFGPVDPADQERVPAIGPSRNPELLDLAFHRTAEPDSATAHSRHSQLVALERARADRLIRLAEGMVTVAALKSREAVAAFEEGVIG